jgi:hypothetical protein
MQEITGKMPVPRNFATSSFSVRISRFWVIHFVSRTFFVNGSSLIETLSRTPQLSFRPVARFAARE